MPNIPFLDPRREARSLFVAATLSTFISSMVVAMGGKLFLVPLSILLSSLTVGIVCGVISVTIFYFSEGKLSKAQIALTTGEVSMVAAVLVQTLANPLSLVKVVFTGIFAGVIMYAYSDFDERFKQLKDTDEWKARSG